MTPFDRTVQQVSAAIGAPGQPVAAEATLEIIRAVFTAFHEPDPLMIEAGFEIIRAAQESESDIAFRDDATQTWRSMVDALLSQAR